MATKNFNWLAPPAQVTGESATPAAGGSLAAGTTYYYRVVAVVCDSSDTDVTEQSQKNLYGQPCAEVSATTDATNKTINLSWTAVSGATGYLVFRSTVSDSYGGTKRFKRLSDGNAIHLTLTTTSMADDGSYGFTASNLLCMMPTGSPTIDGLDFTTNYGGTLQMNGGDSGDPITFSDIYDWMVANVTGYQNYIYSDYHTFSILFGLDFSYNNLATYFKDTNKVLKVTKKIVFENSQSGSHIQFGDIDATSGEPTNGVTFVHFGSRVAINAFDANVYVYNADLRSMRGESYWENGENGNLLGAQYWDIGNVADARDITITNFTYSRIYQNVPVKGVTYFVNLVETNTASQQLLWKLSALQGFNGSYGAVGSFILDECTVYGSGSNFLFGVRNNNATPQVYNIINPTAPNCSDTDGIPDVFRWNGTTDASSLNIYYSILLKIQDRRLNGISGAAITITDGNGDPAVDFSGVDITELQTDSDGFTYVESINITAVTSNTISDSSKSWTTDEWKGRNVHINETGEIYKVASNTATQLTFTEDIFTTPSTSTGAGVIPWVLRRSAVHTPSGANTDSDITNYGDYILMVDSSGYVSHHAEMKINSSVDLKVVLRARHYPR